MTTSLPRWDMTVVYPGLESPEFTTGFAATITAIDGLAQLFNEAGVGQRATPLPAGELSALFERVIERMNAVNEQVDTLDAYIHAFVATDSRNNLAQAKLSELQSHLVRMDQLDTRFAAWIGTLDTDTLIAQSTVAREHAYVLERARQQAAHLMSPAEEDLAAELSTSGATAWGKLHSNLTSQLMVPFEEASESTQLPMSMIRNLAFEADRDLRQRGYEAELASWATVAVPLAAALNGIKGEVNTLASRRAWSSPLAAALFDNNIDRPTLDAMLQAAHESLPDFRRYLKTKAQALGLPALAWFDMFAPVGHSSKVWAYDGARNFIIEQFGSYSSTLSDYADRAFREQWIDAEPRPGKRDGAFVCASAATSRASLPISSRPLAA